MTLYDFLKNIILVLILLYILPTLKDGIASNYSHFFEPHAQIGIISIKGVLQESDDSITQLYVFFKNPSIKGIIIKMDCIDSLPGTSQTIFNEIQHLKMEYPKPIITLVENTCLSGGYIIASACDYIIAPQSALIGGIGNNLSNLQLKILSEHHNNDTLIPPKQDDAQDTAMQNIQLTIYSQCVKQIAVARKLPISSPSSWADGLICTGAKAVEIGLINSVGSMHNAIEVLKEKALIDGEIEWIEQPKHKSLLQRFLNS